MASTAGVHSSMSPAEVYEAYFVPALFQQWGEVVAGLAAVAPGSRVLDVACGTGVAARAAARRAGPDGYVVGLDPSPEMLSVARAVAPEVDWQSGTAEALPFADTSFDAVISQFGLMFFNDKVAALREMQRVLRPGGRMVVAVCGALDQSPGYTVLAELLHRLFGPEVAESFRAPFVLGDAENLEALCNEAGLGAARVERHEGQVRFNSIEALVSTERACVWTLGGLLDDVQFDHLSREAAISFLPFRQKDGRIVFVLPALIITAARG